MSSDSKGQRVPFLSSVDIGKPLETDELIDAANILIHVGHDPDEQAQNAIGHYRRKEMARLIGDATFSASGVAERLSKFEDKLPELVANTAFLQTLVGDFSEAQLALADENPSKRRIRLPADLFGFKARRETREHIAKLREQTSISGMFDIGDLRVGDIIVMNSEVTTVARNTNVIDATVSALGRKGQNKTVALEIASDIFVGRPSRKFDLLRRGTLMHVAGTVHANGARPNPSKIAEGQTLEIIDPVSGEPFLRQVRDERSNMPDNRALRLQRVRINGQDIFHKKPN